LSAPGGRRFVASDLELATAIAVRAALAVDNARLYRDAQEAIRARNDFLSMAAHELRTPITPVQLLLHSLERMVVKEPLDRVAVERIRSKITSAARQADRLGGLVNNLLDLSRLTAGRLDLSIEQVDLSALIDEVTARFSDELARAGCSLSVKHPGPVLGQWDKFRLEQVITNHLTNAMKYGQGKPIDIEVTATETEAVLQVRDRGIGISAEDQARLFKQFERAAPARSYGGVGLGLWIVRQIVAALDGQVSVTSELGDASDQSGGERGAGGQLPIVSGGSGMVTGVRRISWRVMRTLERMCWIAAGSAAERRQAVKGVSRSVTTDLRVRVSRWSRATRFRRSTR
jgi:signal transduction histidine kinase